MSSFGVRFRKLRNNKDMTQQQLVNDFNKAFHYNVTRSAISQYESDKRIPEISLLNDFAKYFGVTVDYLLNGTNIKHIAIDCRNEAYSSVNNLSNAEKIAIDKEATEMIKKIDSNDVIEFCGTVADEEDKEYLKMAYEKFLTDVRIYNKQKYTPKKYKK